MGVTSPFLTAVSSPLLPSKSATPKFPLLDIDDNLSGSTEEDDYLPQLEDQKSQVSDELTTVTSDQAVHVQDSLMQTKSALEPNQVPEWPSHLPSYTDQVFVQNSFLEVPHPTVSVPRRRAASDFSGLVNLEDSGFEVNIEDLQRPLPATSSGSADNEAVYSEQTPMPSGDVQMCWKAYHDWGGGWDDDWAGGQPGSAPKQVPQLPLLVAGQEPFKPKWVYGSSWPFNHAPTTLILDSLPKSLTQEELMAVLDGNGFCGLYDFLFLPTNLKNGRNEGHAIVNFTRHSYGSSFAARIQGFQDWGMTCSEDKPCEVRWSLPLQGLVEHVQSYRNHPCMHESVSQAFRPMIFDRGWKVPFPSPTQPIRDPRMGHW